MPDTLLRKGSTYRFRLTATKDGSAWNLTGAPVVKLYLRKPDGTVLSRTATKPGTPTNEAHYDNLVSELDAVGVWARTWEVTDGAVVQESDPVYFSVSDPP